MADADIMIRVLEAKAVHLKRGTREILRGISLHADAGEIVALIGLSGSGKTTMLRLIAGLETADAGAIAAPKVGMVFQFHYLFEHLCAIDNVTLAPTHVHGVSIQDATKRAQALLDQLGVGHRARALPRELSGGEAQRVAIARALAVGPPLLLLDEPTASLDLRYQFEIGAVLKRLHDTSGMTILLSTHDLRFAASLCTRVVLLAAGRILAHGPPREVLTPDLVGRLFDVPPHLTVPILTAALVAP